MPEIDYENEINKATWLYADQRDPERAKQNLSDAARIVRAILSHWPDDYDANSLMGALLTDLGEPDEAIAHLDRAIRIDPSDVLAYGHKVSALWDKVDLIGAEQCARKQLALSDPKAEEHYLDIDSLAAILERLGRWDEAEQVLQQGVNATNSEFLRQRLSAVQRKEMR